MSEAGARIEKRQKVSPPSEERLTFAYWPVKGLGEKTRWLLAYLGLAYDEVNPSYEAWFGPSTTNSNKHAFGLDFPNLPFLLDGDDVKVTESEAINVYLVEKAGRSDDLLGATPRDKALIRTVEGVFHDVRYEIRFCFFTPNGKADVQTALSGKIGDKVKALDAFVAKRNATREAEKKRDSSYYYALGGDAPTMADFHVAALYYQLDCVVRTYGIDDGSPGMANMRRVYETLMRTDRIAKYLETDKSKRPFCPPAAIKGVDHLVELHV